MTVRQCELLKLPLVSSSAGAYTLSWSNIVPQDYDIYTFEPIPLLCEVRALFPQGDASPRSVCIIMSSRLDPIYLDAKVASHWIDVHSAIQKIADWKGARKVLADNLKHIDEVRFPMSSSLTISL
jgi:hypothetical protein